MYLLTEWEGRTGKYLAQGHGSSYRMTESQIFSRPARPNSVNKHFIIWPFHMDHFGTKYHSQPRESEHKCAITPDKNQFFFFYFFFYFSIRPHLKNNFCKKSITNFLTTIGAGAGYGFVRTSSKNPYLPNHVTFSKGFIKSARTGKYGSYDNNFYLHTIIVKATACGVGAFVKRKCKLKQKYECLHVLLSAAVLLSADTV